MLSDLLSLLIPWVVTHQRETFQSLSGVHVETLDCFSEGWDNGFSLAVEATSPYSNVDVEKASVLRDDKREKDSFSLHWHEQGLQKRLAVDMNDSSSGLNLSYRLRLLSLSEAIGSHL